MENNPVFGCLVVVVAVLLALHGLGFGGRRRAAVGRRLMNIGQNHIVQADGNGRYLVEAAQADDIVGGPDCFLPASVQKVRKGLYMVEFGGTRSSVTEHVWHASSGRIEPRVANVVVEALLGAPEYEYVRPE